MNFLFGNIWKKLKCLALLDFIIVTVALFMMGIFTLAIGIDFEEGIFVAFGVVLLVFSPVFAWISAWPLYGFAELIESNNEILERVKNYTDNEYFEDTKLQKPFYDLD